jgi:putative ATPase
MARPGPAQGGFDFPEEDQFDPGAPLAARMRPRTLDEFAGQQSAVGPGSLLRRAVESGRIPSLILWGPPGCGKTTLARLLANHTEAHFVSLSAVTSGVADLRKVIADARARRAAGRRTVVFIDEIHRFNKAQQDVVLPHVEDGAITLIGATTENPSFEVNAPLLSRVRVIRLTQLGDDSIRELIHRALRDEERGLGSMHLDPAAEAEASIMEIGGGDARACLTLLELAAGLAAADGKPVIEPGHVAEAAQDRRPYYDRAGDAHYDTISAFIKSLKGSDPDGALYWMARMLHAGEDPLFIVRRMVVLAAEDVGLADPEALRLAVACQQAVSFIGLPEGAIPMAECAVYLALAPKSNSAYLALHAAQEAAESSGHMPVPMHLRNAPTRLMRNFGYGAGYRYPHDEAGHVARGVRYLPDGLPDATLYEPGDLGHEASLVARWRAARDAAGGAQSG